MVADVPAEILIQRLQEYIKLWQKYMVYFERALASEEVTPNDEKDFRALQVELTRKAQFLSMAVPEKVFDLWKDIKKLLLDTPSLYILKREVPIRIAAFKTLWHDVSIALNQKQGLLRTVLEERDLKKRGAKRSK
ncbi:MAG: hypothetical protein AB1656_26460 [Candidatus Omnitrophota bacterium]